MKRKFKPHPQNRILVPLSGSPWRSLGSLSKHVFETRTTTGRGHLAYQDDSVSQIFIPSIFNGEKTLGDANGAVRRPVKRENSSFPVAVRVSKTRVLKLPIIISTDHDYTKFLPIYKRNCFVGHAVTSDHFNILETGRSFLDQIISCSP